MYIDDKMRILHMLNAIQDALTFAKGKLPEDLRNDRQLTLAIVKCVEIVGEAGFKTSRNLRDSNSEIPWRALIEMRNHLVHEYHAIDIERVWDSLTISLPAVLPRLQALISRLEEAEN